MTLARDIMTTDVVFVRADTPVREIAKLLADRNISAVPVLDEEGSPVGMVSEGDLLARHPIDKPAQRREWWLDLLAEGETLSPDFIASLRPGRTTAADVMSVPVITVDETMEIRAIARLLGEYRIKRVPVTQAGRVIGIVSRADLIRTLALSGTSERVAEPTAQGFFDSFVPRSEHRPAHAAGPITIAPTTPINTALTAQRFRELEESYRQRQHHEHELAQRTAVAQIQREIEDSTANHVDDGLWRSILTKAADAAQRGEKEFLLLRFPSMLCSDGGRAINAPSDDWPKTLRGEPAELYLRWARDLRPRGFHLVARVMEFPGGFPGDIGLFLSWGA